MLGVLFSAAWDVFSFNDFQIPKAAFHGLSGLVGTLSAA